MTNVHYVRADKLTGKIAGYYLTSPELLNHEHILETEYFMVVDRMPDFAVDHYVNFETGEMTKDPI